jgi:hypothetical protein
LNFVPTYSSLTSQRYGKQNTLFPRLSTGESAGATSKVEWPHGTEELLDEILTDAYGDDEQIWALRQAFEDDVTLPADALVIGEPVEVLEIDYNGNSRLGLTARCRRQDGGEHMVAASEVVFPEGSDGARHVAAYRKWLGLDPLVPPSHFGNGARDHPALG